MSNIDRRDFLKSVATLGAAAVATGCVQTSTGAVIPTSAKSVMGLTLPAMDVVRVGFIGVGERGAHHVRLMCNIDGVRINAICDLDDQALNQSIKHVVKKGHPTPARYSGSEYAYQDMLARNDLDIVIISTPWAWHTPMAVDTMLAGKHAFVEVPAATTLEECWLLVDTAEKTQKNCMMLENVCYGREELMVLNMARQGLFGELVHGEAAYIHELRHMMGQLDKGAGSWRPQWHTKVNGNLYPTHGLGPVSQYMGINRGDRFDYLTSTSSLAAGRKAYAEREFGPDHLSNRREYIAGDMNTTLIKTVKGRSIMVQHDTTTPRPYSRLNLLQGVNGVFSGFGNKIAIEQPPEPIAAIYEHEYQQQLAQYKASGRKGHKPHQYSYHQWDRDLSKWYQHYEHPLWLRMGEEAKQNGGHGGIDFLMLWRMVYCLRHGEALDQDVYDAAAWSSIFPLSVASVNDRSNSKDVPDFTRGVWRTTKPLAIVS